MCVCTATARGANVMAWQAKPNQAKSSQAKLNQTNNQELQIIHIKQVYMLTILTLSLLCHFVYRAYIPVRVCPCHFSFTAINPSQLETILPFAFAWRCTWKNYKVKRIFFHSISFVYFAEVLNGIMRHFFAFHFIKHEAAKQNQTTKSEWWKVKDENGANRQARCKQMRSGTEK